MDISNIGALAASEFRSAKSHHHHSNEHGSHEHGSRAERHGNERSTDVLRQEIRMALSTSFRISFSATIPAYAANSGEQTPADVAADTLGAARQLAAADPMASSKTLVSLRSRVEQAANSVRESFGKQGHEAVDETMHAVSDGLDELENDAARNVVSSASILSAETSLRQRSTVQIRTQEGDVVRLDLRRLEKMSATDVSLTQGDTTMSATEVAISSRTRSILHVKGDLNAAELAAIQNVFAQAESIAAEFFGGDLAAALEMAAGLEFDAEQLSKVNMRLRERQVASISYASLQASTQQPAIVKTPLYPEGPGPMKPSTPTEVAASPPMAEAPPAAVVTEPEVATATPAVSDDAIDGLAAMLANFLRAVNEGFESGSFRYHYSESFKLEILKSVLQVSAPDDSGEAPKTVAALIDTVTAPAAGEEAYVAGS